MTMDSAPKHLYKYRAFNTDTLGLLSSPMAYYSKPSTFNDPLDCSPAILVDTSLPDLEWFVYELLKREGLDVESRMTQLRYCATETEDGEALAEDIETRYGYHLKGELQDWLTREFDAQGVLCLGEKWNSSLMWGHYADSHRGICIEYDSMDHGCQDLRRVRYDRKRGVRVSDLREWQVNKSNEAHGRVRDALLAVKAPSWRYEREWRDIHPGAGLHYSPFEITGIYFGLRCNIGVRTAIIKLLADDLPDVRFYSVHTGVDGFQLKRRQLDVNEELAQGPTLPPFKIFR
jgi:Protein of unknown function (DUF2971)